jgi:hypothetical protein
MVEGDELAPHADRRKSMRLRATALAAVLMAAIFPSLTVQAEAWGVYHCGYCYGESGFGYEVYGCTPIYSYGWTYPAYREHRCASHRYVRRPAAIRGVRRARFSNSAAATETVRCGLSKQVGTPNRQNRERINYWRAEVALRNIGQTECYGTWRLEITPA